MGRQKKSQTDVSQNSLGELPECIRPLTEEDLKLGEREKRLLKELFDWGEESRKTKWTLGKPYGE